MLFCTFERHAWFGYSEAQRVALVAHFISSLLLCSVVVCVITCWELAQRPTSLRRSVLLLSLTVALAPTLCVCMCTCSHFRNSPKAVIMCSHALSLLLFLWQMLWPLGSTLHLPLLLAHCYPGTGDSGTGIEPSCLTSTPFSLTRVLWLIEKC